MAINILGFVRKNSFRVPLKLLTSTSNISFFRKQKVIENPYVFERASEDDICSIIDLMWDCYHPDEPRTNCIGLGDEHNKIFDQVALKSLAQGLTIIARSKFNGNVIGASINETTTPWDPDFKDRLACTVDCPKMRKLYRFLAYIQRLPNLWKNYNTQKVFEIANVFVKRSERGNGVARKLIERSRELGADCGYRVIRVDASNFYAAKICEKLNMQMVQEIPYCSYVGDDHQPIFVPSPPHTSLKIYVDLPHVWEEQRKKFYKKKKK